jgi:molybdopterin converting factor small subunit
VATVRFFGPVREAAGEPSTTVEAGSVGAVIDAAAARYGPRFSALLPSCRVWLNGVPVGPDTDVGAGDEVALLPPVSGG